MSLSVLIRMYQRHGLTFNASLVNRQLTPNVHRGLIRSTKVIRSFIFTSKWTHGVQRLSEDSLRRISSYGPCYTNSKEEKDATCDDQKPPSYTKIWAAERLAALSLLALLPLDFFIPNKPLEIILAILSVMHNHWGLEGVASDYIRFNLFGAVIPKVAHGFVYVLSAFTLAGLLYLIINGNGIAETIKLFWRIH